MHPTSRVHEFPYLVASNEEVGEGIWRMVARSEELATKLAPGEFVNVEVPGNRAHLLRVPLSFAGVDAEEGTVEFVYAAVGDATRRMTQMRPGEGARLTGPCGHGWKDPLWEGRMLLVAGGIGITPVLAAGRWLASKGIEFDAVVGAQTATKLWGIPELEAAGAKRIAITTDDGSQGTKGFTTEAMQDLVNENEYAEVITCGPNVMMAGVSRIAEDAGLDCQVSLERMMGCGFGACNVCNVALTRGGYASCCMDGPVFYGKEVAW